MTTRIPRAHNHWRLMLASNHASDSEPARLPLHVQTVPLLWAPLPWLASWSTAGDRLSSQARDPRTRVARLVASELGGSSAWELIREAQARTFEVVTVENVVEASVWLMSPNRGK